jgi:DNA-binding MurR/RpiR family transcriptional regulator
MPVPAHRSQTVTSRPEIEGKLRSILPSVKGATSRAVQFILAQAHEIPVRSMRDLAKRADVPPVTLVRVAQRLGFAGFEELQNVYVDAVVNGETSNHERAAELVVLARKEGRLGFAAKFADRELALQRKTVARLTEAKLDAAVKAVVKAGQVHVMGRRPFFAAAYSVAYSLSKVKPGTHLLDTGGGAALEVSGLRSGDVFIGFSAYPYSRMTLGVADNAARQGASIIAITDSENAPLARMAEHLFVTDVKGYAFPDSVAGASLIGNILVALVVSTLGSEGLARIQQNEADILHSGEYVIERRRRT